jgi:DNA polymerase III subunit epsilon
MLFDKSKHWSDYPVVAFDTETSGAYPVESEIIELGAVKWFQGQIIGRFQTLLQPAKPLVESNIKIHGITNEMVLDAPLIKDQIIQFCDFIEDTILIAHHAPFDLGFLTPEIEKSGLRFPNNIHLCTSLLSRALLSTTNHKLQTLVKELHLIGGDAHRAFDDAYACLQVFIKASEKLQSQAVLSKLESIQAKKIEWSNYKLLTSTDEKIKIFYQAALKQKTVQIVYAGGQAKSKPRPITVYGIVRNPDGDYLNALCGLDQTRKRFYLSKILDYDLT